MPTFLPAPPALGTPKRKVWTRAEVEALAESAVVNFDRLELIEGELIEKVSKNPPHMFSIERLVRWLIAIFAERAVYQEGSIDVLPEDNPTSLPEPDVVVLRYDSSEYAARRARPDDILLLIEVSDSSVAFDLSVKAGLYARAGIQDYWVLDIDRRRMIVHRKPRGGRYSSTVSYDADERVAPLASPQSELLVGDVLAQ